MNILLPTIGSAGDVYPFVGLGAALQRRGHQVTVITGPYFADVVERAGLGFQPVGTVEDYRAAIEDPELWDPWKGFQIVARRGILPFLRGFYEIITRYDPADTVVAASGLVFGARIAQDKHGYRVATVHLQPTMFRSAYQSPVTGVLRVTDRLPPSLKRIMFRIADALVIDPVLAPDTNAFRIELGLPPVRRIIDRWIHSPQSVIGLFPDWFAPPQPDWPANTRLTGFVRYDPPDGNAAMPQEIARFLDEGEPPIVVTPGTAMQHAHHFLRTCVAACQSLGKRALLLTGHTAHLPASLPPTVRHAAYAPFGQLLPRAAALVHHGGIGTSAQALAAGIPHLVMPMAHDQPDNAARLERLGVAAVLPPAKFREDRIARKLDSLLRSADVRACCALLASKMNNDDALDKTCAAIENMVL